MTKKILVKKEDELPELLARQLVLDESASIRIKTSVFIEQLDSLLNRMQNMASKPQDKNYRTQWARAKQEFLQLKQELENPNKFILDGEKTIDSFRQICSPKILQLSAFFTEKVTPLRNIKNAGIAARGFTELARLYKVRRAYGAIRSGKKFIKSKAIQQKEEANWVQENPIQQLSRNNIRALIKQLKKEGGENTSKLGLLPDEVGLYTFILTAPFRMQHATNAFYPIAHSGRLNSLAELRRYDPAFISTFSTKGNIKELGNDGFVFFRVFVEGKNSTETRYGNTHLTVELTLLTENGWISLHDQLNPFSTDSTKRVYDETDKKLLFTAEPTSIHNKAKNDKRAYDGLKYRVRTAALSAKSTSKKDTQAAFREGDIESKVRTVSFTTEVFYANDIFPGIALATIFRLRELSRCGYKDIFLKQFNASTDREKIFLLGGLIKKFFRIEGKYPVSLPLTHISGAQTYQFSPFLVAGRKDVKRHLVRVNNPDGDGRQNPDLSVNYNNKKESLILERLNDIETQQSTTNKLLKRKDLSKEKRLEHTQKRDALKEERMILEKQNEKIKKEREEYVNAIIAAIPGLYQHKLIEYRQLLNKAPYELLKLLNEHYLAILEENLATIEQLLDMQSIILVELATDIDWLDRLLRIDNVDIGVFSKLSLTALAELRNVLDDTWFDLLEDNLVFLEEIIVAPIHYLKELADYDLNLAIRERGYSLTELIEIYEEAPSAIGYIACDDFTQLLYDEAPDVPSDLLKYAEEFGEEIDFEYIRHELGDGTAEQMLFDQNMAVYFGSDGEDDSEVYNSEDDRVEDSDAYNYEDYWEDGSETYNSENDGAARALSEKYYGSDDDRDDDPDDALDNVSYDAFKYTSLLTQYGFWQNKKALDRNVSEETGSILSKPRKK